MKLEVEIAAPVCEHWRKLSCDVYTEVVITIDGVTYYLDVVAKGIADDRLAVTECKRALTWELIEQARRIRPHADAVWVAVQEPRQRTEQHDHRRNVLKVMGMGLWYVTESGQLREQHPAMEIKRVEDHLIRTALCEGQKSGPPAGSAGAKRLRQDGNDQLRKMLLERGPMTGKEIALELGWTSVYRQRFQTDATAGRIRGIVADRQMVGYYRGTKGGI